jgi:hypothetical protein
VCVCVGERERERERERDDPMRQAVVLCWHLLLSLIVSIRFDVGSGPMRQVMLSSGNRRRSHLLDNGVFTRTFSSPHFALSRHLDRSDHAIMEQNTLKM